MRSSRESSQPRDQTQVSHIAGRFFTVWAIKEALRREMFSLKLFTLLSCKLLLDLPLNNWQSLIFMEALCKGGTQEDLSFMLGLMMENRDGAMQVSAELT